MGDGSTDVTATNGEGATRRERVVLAVATVVVVGALLGAFLTSSLADGLLGRDDGDGSAAADTRPRGSTTTTTRASGAPPASVPGATEISTAPPTTPSTAPSTAAGGADGEAAIGIVRGYLEGCTVAAGLPADAIAAFTYTTTPADSPTRVYVTANEPDGATAIWTVDVTTGELVGADQLAQDIIGTCPPG